MERPSGDRDLLRARASDVSAHARFPTNQGVPLNPSADPFASESPMSFVVAGLVLLGALAIIALAMAVVAWDWRWP